MHASNAIGAILAFTLAAVCLYLSIRHFMQRGYLLNNAYVFASKAERERMDKKPHYRQSAILFSLLSVAFLAAGLSAVLQSNKPFLYAVLPICAIAIVYAVASSIRELMKK
ncbi:MAG: DUF3784 domain-containing protein [Clostridia bacterium]|nr:DUF3784 domain-containing protein [Clostridia bacterium]